MPGELILVVEDNALNKKLLRDVLDARGYRVLESETAEEGLELARARLPALILMDIALPGMSGIEALSELRRDPATRHIPVIAVTASAMPTERSKILAEGFDGYQTKPLSVRELTAEVQRLLASRGGSGAAGDGQP